MNKKKHADDLISESEFTMRMSSNSTQPQKDSPGDSESDAGSEFDMGREYLPDDGDDIEEPTEDLPPAVYSKHPVRSIPDTAKVVDSEQPAPRMDQGATSDTH